MLSASLIAPDAEASSFAHFSFASGRSQVLAYGVVVGSDSGRRACWLWHPCRSVYIRTLQAHDLITLPTTVKSEGRAQDPIPTDHGQSVRIRSVERLRSFGDQIGRPSYLSSSARTDRHLPRNR